MTDVTKLKELADSRRAEFQASLAALRPRISAARLADDAIGRIDPGFEALKSLEDSVRRHPLWALAAIAGISRLIAGMNTAPSLPRGRKARGRALSTATKEKSNGRIHEASNG